MWFKRASLHTGLVAEIPVCSAAVWSWESRTASLSLRFLLHGTMGPHLLPRGIVTGQRRSSAGSISVYAVLPLDKKGRTGSGYLPNVAAGHLM